MVVLTVADNQRTFFIAQLALSASVAAKMSLADLMSAYYANPPAGGGGGGTWGSITGTLSAQTDLNSALGAKAPVASPTFTGTVSGINQDMVPDGTTNKAYVAADKTKLAGIAAGATVNSADATLLARANHTGTQAPSTIVGTAVVTADSRLSDQRTPLDASVTDAKVATAAAIGVAKIAGLATVATSGDVSDLSGGSLSIVNNSPGIYVEASWNGTAWVNVSSRTDVARMFVSDNTASTPVGLSTNDIWVHDP